MVVQIVKWIFLLASLLLSAVVAYAILELFSVPPIYGFLLLSLGLLTTIVAAGLRQVRVRPSKAPTISARPPVIHLDTSNRDSKPQQLRISIITPESSTPAPRQALLETCLLPTKDTLPQRISLVRNAIQSQSAKLAQMEYLTIQKMYISDGSVSRAIVEGHRILDALKEYLSLLDASRSESTAVVDQVLAKKIELPRDNMNTLITAANLAPRSFHDWDQHLDQLLNAAEQQLRSLNRMRA